MVSRHDIFFEKNTVFSDQLVSKNFASSLRVCVQNISLPCYRFSEKFIVCWAYLIINLAIFMKENIFNVTLEVLNSRRRLRIWKLVQKCLDFILNISSVLVNRSLYTIKKLTICFRHHGSNLISHEIRQN